MPLTLCIIFVKLLKGKGLKADDRITFFIIYKHLIEIKKKNRNDNIFN